MDNSNPSSSIDVKYSTVSRPVSYFYNKHISTFIAHFVKHVLCTFNLSQCKNIRNRLADECAIYYYNILF